MNTSDKIYYLKNNELYSVTNGSYSPACIEDVTGGKEKAYLIIDDEYFFYVGMDNVSVSGKKLRSVAANYLSLIFPGDMLKDYGVFQGKGFTVIFIISEGLIDLIGKHPELFSAVRKITTPFIELASRYDDFIFSDGVRVYKKSGAEITAAMPEESGVTADDLLAEMSTPSTSLQLPGVSKSKFSKTPYIIPAAFVGICYIIFLIGQIVSLNAVSKTEKFYQDTLQNVYKAAGVDKSSDPYGLLLYKANQAGKKFQGERVINVISQLKNIADEDTVFYTLNIRDNLVRIDGMTKDFAGAENLKNKAEEVLKTSVSMDDTKKINDGVTFVMRYEQK